MPNSKYKLAIIMRTDLGMTVGKIAVQVGHASVLAYEHTSQSGVFNNSWEDNAYGWRWEEVKGLKGAQFKIVLRSPFIKENGVHYSGYSNGWQEYTTADLIGEEDGLKALSDKARKLGLPVVEVRDFGFTQVEPNTLTCIAIGPALCEDVDKITKGLKLL